MNRLRSASLAAAIVAAATVIGVPPAHGQSLADRVNGAPDGRVQFNFAARSGVCGDGRTFIQTSPNNYSGVFYGNSDYARAACVAGPVRVVIDRADREPLSIQTFVGPADSTLRGVTDLGRVRAQEAADYLLSLATKVDGRAGRDALLPAVLADSANTAAALVSIAKNSALARETRRGALSYMGRSTDGMQTIPSSVTDPILSIARDETDNQSVRQSALQVLGRLDHGAGIAPLMQLSQQTQSLWLAREAMQTLARSGDPRARQYLRTVAKRTDLPEDVLTVALRSLGQDYATAQDAALLRDVYPTLKTDRSRDAVFSALADMGGAENTHWLMGLASNGNEPIQTRRRALEAASRAGAPIGDLIKLYDTTTDPNMKGALIDLYIRNGESAAIDKLLTILKGEENSSVRRRAISQLSRSEDPKVRQALQDLVMK